MSRPHEDESEVVPIPLDRETLRRLVRFARAAGKHPVQIAAALLRDVLIDDEDAHRPLN